VDEFRGREPVSSQWLDDSLVSIQDIRALFRLGRTAAYELTHRPDFPDPVVISPRCYRWWASEVTAFAKSIRTDCPKPSLPAPRPRHCDTSHAGTPLRIEGKIRTARTWRAQL
jgi:predicted DNA-binding transcriptional regulator AlpA